MPDGKSLPGRSASTSRTAPASARELPDCAERSSAASGNAEAKTHHRGHRDHREKRLWFSCLCELCDLRGDAFGLRLRRSAQPARLVRMGTTGVQPRRRRSVRWACRCLLALFFAALFAQGKGFPQARSPVDPALEPLRECLDRTDVKCASAALGQINGPIKTSADYYDLEAQVFLLQHRKDDALAAIHKALQQHPQEYQYLMTEGRIYQSFNDQDPAIRSFLLADRVRPRSPDTLYALGMSFFMMEDYDRAAIHFKHVLALDPQNHKAAFMMGVTDMANLHMPEAKPFLEEALQQQPNNPFYLLQYGLLLSLLGDVQAGIREVRRATDLLPNYAPAHFHLGRLYNQAGDYEHAREELEIAVRLQPGDLPEAYYQLGAVYHRLGNEEKSRQAYQKFEQLKAQRARENRKPTEPTVPPIGP